MMNLQKFETDLKQYEIVKHFANGGFGTLFLIKKKNTNDYYIAKVLKSEYQNDNFLKERKKRELEVMYLCQHPTIVKLYGYSEKDFDGNDNITIIMEYVKNGSLDEIIYKAKNKDPNIIYNNTKKLIILIGVSYGMAHLHKLHIIHRDLKPANVLINKDFYPNLTDFNLSKKWELNKSSYQSTNCGTRGYMAPEILQKDFKYNYKVDVYAFSVLMIQVLINEINNGEINEEILTNELLPKLKKNKVKKPLIDLIYRCISTDQNERPEFKEIFEKLSDLSNDDYMLENVDKKEISSYLKLIKKYETNDEILSLKLLVNDLVNQNKIIQKDYENLMKRTVVFQKNQKKLINDNEKFKKKISEDIIFQEKVNETNQNLEQRVTKLEEIVFNLHKIYVPKENLEKIFISIRNFENLLKKSPLIMKLSENLSSLGDEINKIKSEIGKMNQNSNNQIKDLLLKYEEIKNEYNLIIQNTNINQPKESDSQCNNLMQLIRELQKNVSMLNSKVDSSNQRIDTFEKQFDQFKADIEKENDKKLRENDKQLNDLLSKIKKLESDSEWQKEKIEFLNAKDFSHKSKSSKSANVNEETRNNSNRNSSIDNEQIFNLFEKFEKEISDLKNKCSEQEKTIQETQQQFNINNGNIFDIKQKFYINESQTINNNYQENNDSLLSRFEKMEETINSLIRENQELKQHIKNTEETNIKLSNQQNESFEKNDKFDMLMSMIKDLQNENNMQKLKNESLEAKIKEFSEMQNLLHQTNNTINNSNKCTSNSIVTPKNDSKHIINDNSQKPPNEIQNNDFNAKKVFPNNKSNTTYTKNVFSSASSNIPKNKKLAFKSIRSSDFLLLQNKLKAYNKLINDQNNNSTDDQNKAKGNKCKVYRAEDYYNNLSKLHNL